MDFQFDKELLIRYAKISNFLWGGAIVLFAAVMLGRSCHRPDTAHLSSPNGSIQVELRHCPDDSSAALIIYVGDTLFMSVERLGLLLDSNEASKVTGIGRRPRISRVDDEYLPPWGENDTLRLHYNQLHARLLLDDGDSLVLEVRASNEGVGWRCLRHSDQAHLLRGESTEFCFPSDGTCWSIPANFESYEFAYREQPLSQTADANTPFTFRLDNGLYGSIHEAALVAMPEMTLVRRDTLRFGVWLAPSADSTIGYATPLPTGTIATSWRVITIGHKAVDLPNAALLPIFNEPSRIGSPEWARPIKYVGVWWGMHLGINSWVPDSRHGATTAEAMRHIDFAASHHVDAVLFEGWNLGWEQWGGTQEFDFIRAAPDFDVDSVIRYAHSRGVQVIIHHETGGNIPSYERQMEQAFRWCQERGIHYVKTGYAGAFPNREIHHSRYGVVHYDSVMRLAARHQICLDVHEPIKPTGLNRTYPNLMTAEGARGMEWNAWSDGNPPSHQCILPFTRLLAGPMDYTPGVFDLTYQTLTRRPHQQWNQKDAAQCRVPSTIAHQVALWTVIYSPMVMACDLIENYDQHPMFQFFEDYYPDIRRSHYLDGEIGSHIVVARQGVRDGDCRHYLGAITNERPRDIVVALDFLPDDRQFAADLYLDAPDAHYLHNPTAYRILHRTLTSADTLHLHLAPGGGAAVVFKAL